MANISNDYWKLWWDNTCRIYYDKNTNWVKIVSVENNEIYWVWIVERVNNLKKPSIHNMNKTYISLDVLEKALNDKFEWNDLDYILWKIRNLPDNAYIYE